MGQVLFRSSDIAPDQRISLSSVQLRSRFYRPDIDGLRAIAILSVVLFHSGLKQISGGFTGVDVFFTISGYLIGSHIYSELRSRSFRFSNFYRNRAKRILPALYVVMIAVLTLGLVLLSPHELRDLAKYTVSTTASASNVMLWHSTGYFAANADVNPLLMTWSLGAEEQFYLIVPLILVLAARVGQQLVLPVVILISLSSFALSAYEVGHSPNSAFYLLGSRAWELGVGVAVSIFEVEGRRLPFITTTAVNEASAWIGLILVVLPFFVLSPFTVFPGPAALASVGGTALLLCSSGAWINHRLLSLPPLVYVGRVSYSLYLIHWPILAFLHLLAGRPLPESWGLSAIGVSFGLAVLSYYLVERPFRFSKLAARPLLWRYALVSLALLLVCGTIYKLRGLPFRYPSAGSLDAALETSGGPGHDLCLVKSGIDSPNLAPGCMAADSFAPHIALWGDSHAAAIATELRSISADQGYAMDEYAKTSCPPLLGTGRSYRLEPTELSGCIKFNSAVLHKLIEDSRLEVVVLDAYWDGAFDTRFADQGKLAVMGHDPAAAPSQAESEALLRTSLTETIDALLAAHKKVIVIGDTPIFEIDPVLRMRLRAIPARWRLSSILNGGLDVDPGFYHASDDTPSQAAERTVLQQTVNSIAGARFWDARSRLCNETDQCAYREGTTPLFADDNHLTARGASTVLRDLDLRSQ